MGNQELAKNSLPDGGFGSGEEGNGEYLSHAEDIPGYPEHHHHIEGHGPKLIWLECGPYDGLGNDVGCPDNDGFVHAFPWSVY